MISQNKEILHFNGIHLERSAGLSAVDDTLVETTSLASSRVGAVISENRPMKEPQLVDLATLLGNSKPEPIDIPEYVTLTLHSIGGNILFGSMLVPITKPLAEITNDRVILGNELVKREALVKDVVTCGNDSVALTLVTAIPEMQENQLIAARAKAAAGPKYREIHNERDWTQNCGVVCGGPILLLPLGLFLRAWLLNGTCLWSGSSTVTWFILLVAWTLLHCGVLARFWLVAHKNDIATECAFKCLASVLALLDHFTSLRLH